MQPDIYLIEYWMEWKLGKPRKRKKAIRSHISRYVDHAQMACTDGSFFPSILDANKKGYIPYFNLILDNNLLADDGVLIADNSMCFAWSKFGTTANSIVQVLFFGQVHRAAGHEDHQTPDASKNIMKTAKICHEFNEHVRKDPRVTVLMLPIFDGISVIRKKHAVE